MCRISESTNPVVERANLQSGETDSCADRETFLREMQHRVANSLQIVASILALKAKAVQSEDARFHLIDAYNRVISIAAVQRQLLVSRQSSAIRIDRYLSELGENLASSLIEKTRLSVVVEGATTIESNKAVAIGLVMTELIVNALRHAFPKGRQGNIIAAYRTAGSDWSLSVLDDGIGMLEAAVEDAHSGYGAKIVAALAKRLDARVIIQSGAQGTRVSLVHSTECGDDMKLSTNH